MSSRTDRGDAVNGDVFAPTSVNDAIQILRRLPEASIWSGGTWWMHQAATPGGRESVPDRPILALHSVRELRRVVRSDAQVEVGAAVPIGRLLMAGRRMLPGSISEVLARIGPRPVRNLATLGGALAIPGIILPVTAMMQLHDARVEVRRHGGAHWYAVLQMREQLAIHADGAGNVAGDLITRVRIPTHLWTHWTMRMFGRIYPPGHGSLVVIAAAVVDKSGIGDLRCSLVIHGTSHIRLREAETELAGRTVPLSERDQRILISALEANPLYGTDMDDLMRWRAASSIREFLRRLR